jgi:hypothetical protein
MQSAMVGLWPSLFLSLCILFCTNQPLARLTPHASPHLHPTLSCRTLIAVFPLLPRLLHAHALSIHLAFCTYAHANSCSSYFAPFCTHGCMVRVASRTAVFSRCMPTSPTPTMIYYTFVSHPLIEPCLLCRRNHLVSLCPYSHFAHVHRSHLYKPICPFY